jgi:hypothetical protein
MPFSPDHLKSPDSDAMRKRNLIVCPATFGPRFTTVLRRCLVTGLYLPPLRYVVPSFVFIDPPLRMGFSLDESPLVVKGAEGLRPWQAWIAAKGT